MYPKGQRELQTLLAKSRKNAQYCRQSQACTPSLPFLMTGDMGRTHLCFKYLHVWELCMRKWVGACARRAFCPVGQCSAHITGNPV